MRTYRVAVLPGDGIGPEVTAAAVKVMDRAAKLYDVSLDYREVMVGGIAIDSTGEPLPDITIQSCKIAQAVLFGTVGGSKWDEQPRKLRPEYSIINLRRALNVQTYIRPCKVDFALAGLSPLRRRITSAGIDFILIRDRALILILKPIHKSLQKTALKLVIRLIMTFYTTLMSRSDK